MLVLISKLNIFDHFGNSTVAFGESTKNGKTFDSDEFANAATIPDVRCDSNVFVA